MFEADMLSELNFELEFNLPKEISDNQDHIRLSVSHAMVPTFEIQTVPIWYKSRPIRTPGEIHCIEHYSDIKDILPLLNRWVNRVYCIYGNLNSSRSNYFVEAKLYAYKNDGSLFKRWNLIEFCPMFNQDPEYFTEYIKLIFKFENIADAGK